LLEQVKSPHFLRAQFRRQAYVTEYSPSAWGDAAFSYQPSAFRDEAGLHPCGVGTQG
jgi:hypothetical protein